MPRLFIAIDLTPEVRAELARLQPRPQPGIRPVSLGHLHLTLHFLGETEVEPTLAALKTVPVTAFALTLAGTGAFSGRHGTTLWAGVQDNPDLHRLHATIANALSPTGFRPETRPYSPHITLARCRPEVSRRVIDSFLTQNTSFLIRDIPVQGFTLYSSVLERGGPQYTCEGSFPS